MKFTADSSHPLVRARGFGRRLGLLAQITATIALVLAATPAKRAQAASTRAFVLTTDFATGSLSTVNLDTRAVSSDVVAGGICADARMCWHEGRLYVVNRLGCDNILVLDPANDFDPIRQFSTGNGSNPSDIVVLSPTKAYIPRYELGGLAIADPSTGALTGQISLAAFADADGIPEMDRALRYGDRVFVSIQRLDRNAFFSPTDASYVAVIDANADTLVDVDPGTAGVQAIRLTGKNPVTSFGYDDASGRLLLGCAGFYGALDGGIEWINPVTMASEGYAITEAALGGDVGDVAWNDAARSYALISDASFDAHLVSWSATSQTRLAYLFSPGGFTLPDLEINDRNELYVLNRQIATPGVYVFSTTNDAVLAGPLDTGLPPYQVIFDRSTDVLAVAEPLGTSPPIVRLSAPRPNPARHSARIGLSLLRQGRVRVEIFDPSGRRVRTLVHDARGPGDSELRWDLLNDRGERVTPGLYLVRAAVGDFYEKSFVQRVAVLY